MTWKRQSAACSGALTAWTTAGVGPTLKTFPVPTRNSAPSTTSGASVFRRVAFAFSPSGPNWTTRRNPAAARTLNPFPWTSTGGVPNGPLPRTSDGPRAITSDVRHSPGPASPSGATTGRD
jgi:hypothetical protein